MPCHKHFSRWLMTLAILAGLVIGPAQTGRADPGTVDSATGEAERTESNSGFVDASDQERFRILLKSRQFTPPADLGEGLAALAAAGGESRHMLVQLDHIPDAAEKKALAEAGIRLLGYVPNYAWFATVAQDVPVSVAASLGLRWLGPVLTQDKLDPFLTTHGFGSWAKNPDGSFKVQVLCYEDVPRSEARQLLAQWAVRVESESDVLSSFSVSIESIALAGLLQLDAVQFVGAFPPPVQLFNDGSTDRTRSDQVQARGITGQGVIVALWDGDEADDAHDDLGSRILQGESPRTQTTSDHSTHVACTMAGSGAVNSTLSGHAPNAPQIVSFDYAGQVPNEMQQARTNRNIALANNSWGRVIGWYWNQDTQQWLFLDNQDMFGEYQAQMAEYDTLVRDHRLALIWAVGNDRDDAGSNAGGNRPPDWDQGRGNNGYDTISPPATAKNVISVGAIDDSNGAMSTFSNWGPTNDGRIKPELVAPGVSIQSCSDDPDDTYVRMSGTSMAAPAVAGISALLIQQYRNTYSNADPWPSTIKALLVQSAHDLDDGTAWYNSGPDYASGYGLVDAKIAVDLVRAKALRQDTIAHSENDSYEIWIPTGVTQLKVTLAWDDPAGVVNADPTLVNDLDVVLIGPTTTHFPWILDPNHPQDDAFRGRDGLNNLEQVLVTNPVSGKWTIRINGFSVPQGPQQYSIVSEALFEIVEPGKGRQVYAGPATNPQKIVIQTTKPRDALIANQFQVTIGGQPANVLTLYEGSDRYVLEIAPAVAPGNGAYDLSVMIASVSVWNVKEKAVLFADTTNVDVTLVIDRSGSMGTAKMNAAKDAAKQFVDLMQADDMVGVVSFDDRVETNFVLTSIDRQSAVKTGAKNAIDALYSRGYTSIGGGLQRSQQQLSTLGQANHPWAIVLLSDGLENTVPYVRNVLPTIKASKTSVHTVGLGSDADEALMLDIAAQTGGTYNFAPTPQELAGIYNTLAGAVANRQTLLAATGVAQQGVTDQKDVVVDSTVSDATFSISWSNGSSTIDLVLRKPNGQIVDPTAAASDPNIEYVAGSTYKYYRIIRPSLVTGVWQMQITGRSVAVAGENGMVASPLGEGYLVRVSARATLTSRFYLDRSSYLTTEPIKFVVTLSDQQPIRSATVQVSAQAPSQAAVAMRSSEWINVDGDTVPDPSKVAEFNAMYAQTMTTITLYDDGLHGDGRANDGVYANTFNSTNRPGTWVFSASASGLSNGGETFARYAEISTYIAQNSNPRIRQLYLPLVVRTPENAEWRASNLLGRTVLDLSSTSAACNTVFAATDAGVYRSWDGGRNWAWTFAPAAALAAAGPAPTYEGLVEPAAGMTTAIAVCPANPNIVYAGGWGSGVYRSADGGNSWQQRAGGLSDPWIYDLAVAPNNCELVYAASSGSGVFKTTNGGSSWQGASAGLGNGLTRAVAVAPSNPNRVYVGTTAGVYRSDNGAGWWAGTSGLPGVTAWGLAVAPGNADTVYVGLDGRGVYRSWSGGSAWQAVNAGLGDVKARALIMDPLVPSTLYAGRDDGGGVYRSLDGGARWDAFNAGLGSGHVKALWLDGGSCRRLLAGADNGVWYYGP